MPNTPPTAPFRRLSDPSSTRAPSPPPRGRCCHILPGPFITLFKINWGIGMLTMPFLLEQAGTVGGVVLFLVAMLLAYDSIMRLLDCVYLLKLVSRARAARSRSCFSPPNPSRREDLERSWTREDLSGHKRLTSTSSVVAATEGEAEILERAAVARVGGPHGLLEQRLGVRLIPGAHVEGFIVTYSHVVRAGLGDWGELLSLLFIVISQYGCQIAFLNFIADNMARQFGGAQATWVILACIPLLGFACLSDLRVLAPVAGLGLAFGLGFEAVVVSKLGSAQTWAAFARVWADAPLVQTSTLPIGLGIAAFINEGAVLIAPNVEQEARAASKHGAGRGRGHGGGEGREGREEDDDVAHRYGHGAGPFRCTLLSFGTVYTCCYLVFAIAGFALFWRKDGSMNSDVALCFGDTGLDRVAVVLYCLQLLPSYAMVFYSVYDLAERTFLLRRGVNAGNKAEAQRWRRTFVVVRLGLVVLSGVVALAIPRFGDYVALVGAASTAGLIYILPHLCWLKMFWLRTGSAMNARRCLSVAFIVLGIVTATLGTEQAATALSKGSENATCDDAAVVANASLGRFIR